MRAAEQSEELRIYIEILKPRLYYFIVLFVNKCLRFLVNLFITLFDFKNCGNMSMELDLKGVMK